VDEFFSGSNNLSLEELTLVEAYETLDRPDLAACVRAGKKYQRLDMAINSAPDLLMLLATREAFTGERGLGEITTIEDWVGAAKRRFVGDEGLAKVMARYA
jgi:hypothetical protein